MNPKFKNGDYIKNIYGKAMAVVSNVDKKGYYHFKHFYGTMFEEFKDVSTFTLQVDYDKFYELMNENEVNEFNEMIKKSGLII